MIAHKIQVTRVMISGIAKPNWKMKRQIKKKTNHKPIKNTATILVSIPKRRLWFFKWSPKMNIPIGNTANSKIAKMKWIKYCLVKIPMRVSNDDENSRNKRHTQPISSRLMAVKVKIPKAIPPMIKLKLKKSLTKPKSLSEPLIQLKPLWYDDQTEIIISKKLNNSNLLFLRYRFMAYFFY